MNTQDDPVNCLLPEALSPRLQEKCRSDHCPSYLNASPHSEQGTQPFREQRTSGSQPLMTMLCNALSYEKFGLIKHLAQKKLLMRCVMKVLLNAGKC